MNAKFELTKRGFKKQGFWKDTNTNKYDPNLNPKIIGKRYFLYAYVIDNEVMYIGKCHRTVGARMNDYALNKSDDFQGKHVNGLRAAIKNNIEVDIYIYIPDIQIVGTIKVDDKEIKNQDAIEDITKGILHGLETKYLKEFRDRNECKWNTQS